MPKMTPRTSPPMYSNHQRCPHRPQHHRARSTYVQEIAATTNKTTTLKYWLANGTSDPHETTGRLIAHHRPSKLRSLDRIESGRGRVEGHSTTSKCGREPAPRIRPQQPQIHSPNPSATQLSKQGEAIVVCALSTATALFAPDSPHVLSSFLV